MIISGIPAEKFEGWYPKLEWAFESFAERSRGEATKEDLAGQVMATTSQCWIVWDNKVKAVALTEVKEGRIKSVTLTHCAGDGREAWQKPLVNELKKWAKHIGATRFATVNRPGWTPFLREMGLRETHRIMEQDIG